MLHTYDDLLSHLSLMVRIRSANYVESDCDIEAMLYTVHEDINQSVVIDVIKQEHVIVKNETDIVLRNNNAIEVSPGLYDELSATERYTDVFDIVDSADVSITQYMHNSDINTWTFNNYENYDNVYCIDDMIGDSIYFIRKKILDIKYLTPEVYNRLLNAYLEGVMYYIQTAIPNQIDGQAGNMSYQRYVNAKTNLTNLRSQFPGSYIKEFKW